MILLIPRRKTEEGTEEDEGSKKNREQSVCFTLGNCAPSALQLREDRDANAAIVKIKANPFSLPCHASQHLDTNGIE